MSQKLAIIDSWAKSDDIDIFSPQLYTSGVETEPEFAITQCGSTIDTERTCSYERLKHMKTKWVPSLSYAGHYPAVKKFFAQKGITVRRSALEQGIGREGEGWAWWPGVVGAERGGGAPANCDRKGHCGWHSLVLLLDIHGVRRRRTVSSNGRHQKVVGTDNTQAEAVADSV